MSVSRYDYERVEGWGKFPQGGVVSDIAADSEGRVYACVRLTWQPMPARKSRRARAA